MNEYTDCRHYNDDLEGCVLYFTDCHECRICPKCGARTQTERAGIMDLFGTHASILEVRHCCMCGNRTRGKVVEHLFPVKPEPEVDNECAVSGCKFRSYGTYYGDMPICDMHHRQIKSWRYKCLPESRFPLIERGEYLLENPKYRGQQRRRGKK